MLSSVVRSWVLFEVGSFEVGSFKVGMFEVGSSKNSVVRSSVVRSWVVRSWVVRSSVVRSSVGESRKACENREQPSMEGRRKRPGRQDMRTLDYNALCPCFSSRFLCHSVVFSTFALFFFLTSFRSSWLLVVLSVSIPVFSLFLSLSSRLFSFPFFLSSFDVFPALSLVCSVYSLHRFSSVSLPLTSSWFPNVLGTIWNV